MKKEYRDRWVAALRSGDYIQGQGSLKNGDKFCCLGVLCDILAKELDVDWEAPGRGFHRELFDGYTYLLPDIIKEEVDLEGLDPVITIKDEKEFISQFNDERGITFAELADAIEEQL